MDSEDFAIKFEGKLISSSFSAASGHKVTFLIHPSDILESEGHGPRKNSDNARVRNMATKLNSRFQFAAVELSEESDEPVKAADAKEGDVSVALAGMLCRDFQFEQWFNANYPDFGDEYPLVDKFREVLGVESRADLKTNEAARKKLENIRWRFMNE